MNFFRLKISSITLFLVLMGFTTHAQEKGSPVVSRGIGSASSSRLITKVVKFIDEETTQSLKDIPFSLNKSSTIIISGKSDLKGYAVLRFPISNYYQRLLLKINDSNFLPVDDRIIFPSNRKYIDTIVVKLKRDDGFRR